MAKKFIGIWDTNDENFSARNAAERIMNALKAEGLVHDNEPDTDNGLDEDDIEHRI